MKLLLIFSIPTFSQQPSRAWIKPEENKPEVRFLDLPNKKIPTLS